jgi:hypothetical protein
MGQGGQPPQSMDGTMQPPAPPEGVPEGTTPPQPPGQGSMEQGQEPPQGGQQNGSYDVSGQPPAPPGGTTPPGMMPGQEAEMPTYFYFIFGAEGLCISCLLVFLIMSQMNMKSVRYVFGSSSKIIAFIVLVVALTAAITFGCANISLPKPEPQQPQAPPGGPESSVAYSAINEIF